MNRATIPLLAASLAAFASTASGGAIGLITPSLLSAVVNGSAAAAQSSPGSVPASRLVSTFSTFAGSTANAQSLVEGLRTGTTIALVDANNVTTSFSPATKPMGWGNVKIALALADAELEAAGITNPTPAEIEVALNGGTVGTTTFTGVLTQRASGMGWGQIARANSLNLGTVVSGVSKPAGANAQAGASGNSLSGNTGVVSASGAASGAGSVHGMGGKGVVTAAGPASQVAANGNGNGNGNGMGGKGVVTAAGPASQVAAANGHASAASLTTGNGEAITHGVTSAAGAGASANRGHGKGRSGG